MYINYVQQVYVYRYIHVYDCTADFLSQLGISPLFFFSPPIVMQFMNDIMWSYNVQGDDFIIACFEVILTLDKGTATSHNTHFFLLWQHIRVMLFKDFGYAIWCYTGSCYAGHDPHTGVNWALKVCAFCLIFPHTPYWQPPFYFYCCFNIFVCFDFVPAIYRDYTWLCSGIIPDGIQG